MNAYKTYFDRQGVSPGLHDKLLKLGGEAPAQNAPSPLRNPEENEPPARFEMPLRRGLLAPAPKPVRKWLAIAACAALILGVGLYAIHPLAPGLKSASSEPNRAPGSYSSFLDNDSLPAPAEYAPEPENAAANADSATDTNSFPLGEDARDGDLAFYLMPALNFVDATKSSEAAADIALPEGSFEVDLTLADLQKLFWGPDGKPETLNPDTDLPWSLYWGGYTVWMRAVYDGDGALWELTVHGERAGDTFTLTLSPGCIPPTCIVEPGGADSVEFQGVSVSSRLKEYDRNGDGKDEVICTSEYLTDAYGCRFENVRAPRPEEEADNRESAIWFNTLFVRYALTGDGLYLDHIAQAENIPAWEG